MKRYLKYVFLVLLFSVMISVNADVKCDDGKPGDTVNCVITNAGYGGTIKKIKVDTGLSFVSCDVCNDTGYTIEANKSANFKFKIDSEINESKTLNATFGGETAKIKVVVESTDDDEESDETIYTVTLVPGNNQPNQTRTCTVNSLNTTCNVTLDEIDSENFTGWGKEKNCAEGAKGSVKVNKNVTYYACYKDSGVTDSDTETDSTQDELNKTLLLKSLIVKNGDEKIDLGFSIRIFEYSVVVPTSVESLDVSAVAQDESVAVLVSGNDELKNETNVITITLTNDSGEKNEYVINVEKSDDATVPLLSSLVVGGYNLGFDPEKFVYTLTIDQRISSLNIEATPENEKYEYKISGNSNLKDGSQIKVVVSNNDSDQESTYIINIEQNTSSLLIYIAIGGIILLILIILLIVVVKKGRKTNKNNTPNNNVKSQKNVKGQVVNGKANIPEVKPTIPVAPATPNTDNVKKDETIETLDL